MYLKYRLSVNLLERALLNIKTNTLTPQIKYSFVKILTGSDLSPRRLPIMSAKSINPGPVIWLTACLHGDEVGGVVVIHEIFKRIQKKLLKGAIYSFPLMNPMGFDVGSRNISLSKEDLNRSFPGNKNGSLAERIADKVFTTITQTNPCLVLDLHNDWIKSMCYCAIDSEGNVNKEIYEKAKLFCNKTGLLPILDTDQLKNTLSDTLIEKGIPSLTLELGESHVVNEQNTEYGIKSILNILSFLEMIQPIKEIFQYAIPEIFKGKIDLKTVTIYTALSDASCGLFIKENEEWVHK